MGSGISGLYKGTQGSFEPKNKVTYNRAGSDKVGRVKKINILGEAHHMPIHSEPNSVSQKFKNGVLYEERYFGANGDPYLDIDYTTHGTPKNHTNPHQHVIIVKNGRIIRGKQEPIK